MMVYGNQDAKMHKRLLAIVLILSLLRLTESGFSRSQPPSKIVDEEASDIDIAVRPTIEAASGDIGKSQNLFLSTIHSTFTADTLAIANRQVYYQNPKKLSRANSCKYCTSSKCQSLDKIRERLTKCRDKKSRLVGIIEKNNVLNGKKHLSGYYDAVLRTCFQNYCRNFKSEQFCGLKPPGKTVNTKNMKKKLREEESELRMLTKKFKQEVVPLFRHKDYMKRREAIMEHRRDAEKTRSLALNARKDNAILKRKMQSTKYRRNVFNIYKWGNETKFYTQTLTFWQALNSRLHLAVRTSPLAVEKLMKVMKSDMGEMMKDRAAVGKKKRQVSSMEKKHEAYVEAKEWLEEKLDGQQKAVDVLKAERKLLNKVGGDLTKVLRRLLDRIREGKIKLGCGEDALATLISEYAT